MSNIDFNNYKKTDIMFFRMFIKELLKNEILFSTNGRNYGIYI